MVANIEKKLFHLISYKILGKVAKFQRVRSKALRVMGKTLCVCVCVCVWGGGGGGGRR